MKKTLILLIVFSLLIGMNGFQSEAAPAASKNVTVNASVPNSSSEIDIVIRKYTDGDPDQNPWTNSTEVTAMSFDTLSHTLSDGSDAGQWYAEAAFAVIIYAQGFGHQYEINSTCTGLTSGGSSLPTGSFGANPAYASSDEWSPGDSQGSMPAGAQLGTGGSAVASDKLIYRSEDPSTARILQTHYSIPPYAAGGGAPYAGYEPVPLNQASGAYSGTVTITIANI